MAAVYDYYNGDVLTQGLQGCNTCDEALKAAKQIASTRKIKVVLEDDDGQWVVFPSGKVEELGGD